MAKQICRIFAITILLLLPLLSGCGGASNGDPFGATVRVTEADLGAAITIKVGETVEIVLSENPSTGYQWRCTWTPSELLTLAGDVFLPRKPALPGTGGTRYFLLEAKEPGEALVTLQYGRWWPGGETEEPQYLTIHILP